MNDEPITRKKFSIEEDLYIIDHFGDDQLTEVGLTNDLNYECGNDRTQDSVHSRIRKLRKKGLLGTKGSSVSSGYVGRSIILAPKKPTGLIRRLWSFLNKPFGEW